MNGLNKSTIQYILSYFFSHLFSFLLFSLLLIRSSSRAPPSSTGRRRRPPPAPPPPAAPGRATASAAATGCAWSAVAGAARPLAPPRRACSAVAATVRPPAPPRRSAQRGREEVGGKGGRRDGGAARSYVLWLLLHQIALESGNFGAPPPEMDACTLFRRALAGAGFEASHRAMPKGL
jgi:hypothetical protein